jgi:hypothetical protein
MTFVFPALLGGLTLIGVPVLLHLIMKQKPRHLHFPAFRFLLQRHRTNQRKLRLRHLLLLALRVLLVALICLALARPKVFSERLQLGGDRPAAVVLLFDTSMSMEYAVAGKSRLEDARRRALELLADLPEGSQVAVLDTAEPTGEWLPSVSYARERINALKLRPANGPVTSRLAEAYRLLADLDQQGDDEARNLLRFLYVFSDRTQECWDAGRAKDLQTLRERVGTAFKSVFVDVGADKPVDLAIASLELPRPVVAADDRAVIRATLQAVGSDFENEVSCRIDGEAAADRKPVKLKAGQSAIVSFERRGLPLGIHQAEVTLATADALPFTNARFATFEVRGARRVLILTDEEGKAAIWRIALEAQHAFDCEVRTSDEARNLFPDTLAGFHAVCLVDVAKPEPDLWDKLKRYVAGGGGLAVLPGGDELDRERYNAEKAQDVLPGRLVKPLQAPTDAGVEWAWTNATYQHPMMKSFRVWNESPDTDFVRYPRAARRYWEVEPRPGSASVLVSYADKESHPAIVERIFDRRPTRGRVLLFTTTMDGRPGWNNYVETITSFYMVLAQLSARYLAGDDEVVGLNYLCGQSVAVALPATPRFASYNLQGPGFSATESLVPRTENQGELTLNQAVTPGNYTLLGGDGRRTTAFSMNVPPGEAVLARVPVEAIEGLLGEGAVVPVGHSTSLRDAMQGRWGQPLELFPWLMLALLVFLAVENLLANRFYRRAPQEDVVPAAGGAEDKVDERKQSDVAE